MEFWGLFEEDPLRFVEMSDCSRDSEGRKLNFERIVFRMASQYWHRNFESTTPSYVDQEDVHEHKSNASKIPHYIHLLVVQGSYFNVLIDSDRSKGIFIDSSEDVETVGWVALECFFPSRRSFR